MLETNQRAGLFHTIFFRLFSADETGSASLYMAKELQAKIHVGFSGVVCFATYRLVNRVHINNRSFSITLNGEISMIDHSRLASGSVKGPLPHI